jgi:hypothetical protein
MNVDLESTLFYTMSTIAQTLSGSMGLLGAIVLFALQETGRSIERAARELAELPHATDNALYLRHLLTRRSFHEFARRYGDQLATRGSTETPADLLVHHSTLTWELDHDAALRRSFFKALAASGFLIGFSILACGFAPQLATHPAVGYTALGIGMVGAASCLALYGALLRVMLRTTPPEEPTSRR